MWQKIEEEFTKLPSQAEVARYMLETGIRVDGKKLYFDRVAVSHSQLATALEKDKRIVTATAKTISDNPKLYQIYSKLRPICNLFDMALDMGWGVIGLDICDTGEPGTMGEITSIIGNGGISIRQAQCPATRAGLLYIITDTPIPSKVIQKIREVQDVMTITIFQEEQNVNR